MLIKERTNDGRVSISRFREGVANSSVTHLLHPHSRVNGITLICPTMGIYPQSMDWRVKSLK